MSRYGQVGVNPIIMLSFYLKSSIRSFRKQKLITTINLLGLIVGIASVLLIANYLKCEFSYDNFHTNQDRLYRIESRIMDESELVDNWASTPNALASLLNEQISGIESLVRITVQRNQREKVVSCDDKLYRENKVCYTEPSFFRVFSFPLAEGEAHSALSRPKSVVITESMARKYYGTDNPMGQLLTFSTENERMTCEITGILKDLPSNTHLDFDFFISWNSLPDWYQQMWQIYGVYTYALLSPEAEPEVIQSRFDVISPQHIPRDLLNNNQLAIDLQPIADIHFNPQKPYEIEKKGNRINAYLLVVMALAILIIAWINFVNLYSSSLLEQLKSFCIRKLSGARRKDLYLHFLSDSLIINSIAFPVAILLAHLVQPFFNRLLGTNLAFSISGSLAFWSLLLLLMTIGSFLSGIIPAYKIRAVHPATLISDRGRSNPKKGKGQELLVTTQFAASIILIIGSLTVFQQIDYMQNQSPGYSRENIMAVKFPSHSPNYKQKLETFKQEVLNLPSVSKVSCSGVIPGMEVANFIDAKTNISHNDDPKRIEVYPIDHDFLNTYKIKVVDGFGFADEFQDNKSKILLNEEAVGFFGFSSREKALGNTLQVAGKIFQITGVVGNFHQQSLAKAFTPLLFIHEDAIPWLPSKYISIHLGHSQKKLTCRQIESTWNNLFSDSLFDYRFLDDIHQTQYTSEINFGLLFSLFSGLTLFISGIGLLGLAIVTAQKRTKEIGIRKVNGASTLEILLLLNQDFIKWIAVSFLVACPIAYLVMDHWLDNFAFKSALSPLLFITGGLIALGITISTICLQGWQAAKRNPIESIRNE